jgi:predicted acyltransferase
MLLMVSSGLRISRVVAALKKTPDWPNMRQRLWETLATQTDHATWAGVTLWDFIQSSFMFMVGVALAFSLASRQARGQSFGRMLFHAIVRSLALVFLGILLQSNWSKRTDWTFFNVLEQIGLGYAFLFLLAWMKPKWQLAAAGGILLIYWTAFVAYPKPPADLNPTSVNLPADWNRLEGFSSHWEKNTNLAARFDHWFLNRFPQQEPGKSFEYNAGGYTTLNFVPSLATMIFGLLCGQLLRERRFNPIRKVGLMLAIGAAGVAVGWALGWTGICPIVKRIWTPSWAIFSGGVAFIALAVFYLVMDIARLRAWAYPLVVMGANAILVYCLWQINASWFRDTMTRHFGNIAFNWFGEVYAPAVQAGLFLLYCWLICWWLYRQKAFIRI